MKKLKFNSKSKTRKKKNLTLLCKLFSKTDLNLFKKKKNIEKFNSDFNILKAKKKKIKRK